MIKYESVFNMDWVFQIMWNHTFKKIISVNEEKKSIRQIGMIIFSFVQSFGI